MKTQSFSSRSIVVYSYAPYTTDKSRGVRVSWLFNTGLGGTDRYVGPIQARVPAFVSGNKVKLEGFPLSQSDGSKYKNDGKQICEVSNTGDGNFWFSFDSLSQEYKKLILANGIFTIADQGYLNVSSSRSDAIISVSTYQSYITPTGQNFTSGTIARYTKYRLQWTTDAEDDSERSNTQVWITISNENGTNSKTVKLANGALTYDLDTTQWSAGEKLLWKVKTAAWKTGNTRESSTYSLNLTNPSAKVDDLRPTSKTYYGFDQIFSWAFTGVIDSSSISEALQQSSAVLQYRTDNMADPAQFSSVSDGTTHVTVNCKVLPIGTYQWRVVATSNVGTTHASSWVQVTNTEVPISVKGTTPSGDAHAPRAIVNRFSWAFSVDSDDAPGDVVQQSATLHYKANNEDAWHETGIEGSQQYIDISANTFAAGCTTLDWYVVAVANTGSTATSETITVSTKDARSTPVAISPAGEYLDDAVQGINFVWAHANVTGTAQHGWELSYSTDSGASYTVLAQADDAASSYQANAGTFSSGVIYWRVRTKNTDDEFGDYSNAAIFAIRRAPVAPVISYYDNKPLATMRWQAREQDGYEVAVDGVSLGVRYGTGKVWQSNEVIADGKHLLQVRIYNAYGDVSPWSSCEINVKNQPGQAVTAKAESRWGEVLLRWGGDESYILRDGALIAKGTGGTYTDRTSAVPHLYVLRIFDSDGYYTDSKPILAGPSVPYAAIGLLDGTQWMALKYSTSYQNYSKSTSLGGSLQQYWGKEKPVWHDAGNRTVTHTISHACKNADELTQLRSLAGREVVYKDRDGHLAIGIFSEIQESRDFGCTPMTLTITETQQKEVHYDTV